MHRFISALIFIFLVLPMWGQELIVRSFSEKTNDIAARTSQRLDNNGKPCALVKVLLVLQGAEFDPNVVGSVENYTNEYWVYLPAGSKHLRVKHSSIIPTDIVFEEYGIRSLSSLSTYELVLSQLALTSQYLAFNVEPKDALVTVNGELWTNTNGTAIKFVPFGNYKYRVESKMYYPKTGQIEVNDPVNKVQVPIVLQPAFGYITIPDEGVLAGATIYIDKEVVGKAPLTSKPLASGVHTVMAVKQSYQSQELTVTVEDGQTHNVIPPLVADFSRVTLSVANHAEIWINGEFRGIGQWEGDLNSGDYIFETRLTNHRSSAMNLHVSAAQPTQTISLESPKPILGSVNVVVNPDGSNVYIDDSLMGQSPLFLPEYLIGEHRVRITRDNYEDYVAKVNIQENRVTEVAGELNALSDVIFSCNVSDARLFVDKKEIGTASDIKKLTYGYHEVRFEAGGFRECSSVIEVNQPRQSFEFKMVAEKRMFTVKGIEFAMVPVKGGTFSMGAIAQHNEEQTDNDEVLQVFLSDYNIGETEVTQALWNAVMGSNPSYFKGANLPVESITWNDCVQFIRRLNRLTGENFRMPTEAEWEYAARGGILSRGYRYSGSNNIDDVSWYAENSELKSHEVATKASNELGIYDMSGNVWEWTSDYWRRNYNSKRSGFSRVYRGGSWNDAGGGSRVLYRNRYDPTGKDYDIGLRLAL